MCAGLRALSVLQVDLTLHGHHHSYQRTCPVIAGKCINPPTPSTAVSNSSRSSSTKNGDGSGGSSGNSSSGARGRVRSSGSAVYVDASAPVHLVIGNAGAELSWNVEPQPAEIWQVGGRFFRIRGFALWIRGVCWVTRRGFSNGMVVLCVCVSLSGSLGRVGTVGRGG